jgi:hypothetical protein
VEENKGTGSFDKGEGTMGCKGEGQVGGIGSAIGKSETGSDRGSSGAGLEQGEQALGSASRLGVVGAS